jgi:hypothetical protein
MVSSKATQAVYTVDVYGLRPVQSGQLSMDLTKRIQRVQFLQEQQNGNGAWTNSKRLQEKLLTKSP